MDLTEILTREATEEGNVHVLAEGISLTVLGRSGPEATRETLVTDVRRGLSAPRKWMSPRWFYDARGSELFEQITELPEYYQTRTEAAILRASAADIAALCEPLVLVELGAGSCTKTGILLESMRPAGLRRFVPVDVSASALEVAARRLAEEFPGLVVDALVAEFHPALVGLRPNARQVIAFLGSTIGNLLPHQRVDLLAAVGSQLGSDGALLLGLDLVKPAAQLHAAYNDAAGVTADFNRNLLNVLNRELDADFDVDAFEHDAPYDAGLERVEMHLRSTRDHWVDVPGAQLRVHFAAGETLLTEISAKFTRRRVDAELHAAGLRCAAWFTDAEEQFALCLARAA